MGINCLTTFFMAFVFILCSLYFLFGELDAVLQRLGHGSAPLSPHVAYTSDKSADESEASHPRQRVRSKRTFKKKKVWAADEFGRFFVTGFIDAAGKPSQYHCRICRKDVSVLTHGPHEVLKHFQGVKYFACDQRLRLETPGWRVMDFEENPLTESELERRRGSIVRGRLVIRDREYLFAEDLIVDDYGAPDARLSVLSKVSSLVEVLRLGGSYELVHQLWSQLTLTAS